jgi:hypothetical protein
MGIESNTQGRVDFTVQKLGESIKVKITQSFTDFDLNQQSLALLTSKLDIAQSAPVLCFYPFEFI